MLYEDGLVAALGWLADEMTRRHGLVASIHPDEFPEVPDEDVRAMLYEGVRELLSTWSSTPG